MHKWCFTLQDITSHGDLQCNDAVVVQWPDNQSYDGTFVKYIAEAKYAIHFDDGHRSKVHVPNRICMGDGLC